jgi:hypothetical protein
MATYTNGIWFTREHDDLNTRASIDKNYSSGANANQCKNVDSFMNNNMTTIDIDISDSDRECVNQLIIEYKKIVSRFTFDFSDKFNTITKHALSMPLILVNSEKLIKLFTDELTNAINYCIFTRIPMNILLVELNETIETSPYKARCSEYIKTMYESLDLSLMDCVRNDIHTKQSSFKLVYNKINNNNLNCYGQCVEAMGQERTKSLILNRLRYNKLIVMSCVDLVGYCSEQKDTVVGWIINFKY